MDLGIKRLKNFIFNLSDFVIALTLIVVTAPLFLIAIFFVKIDSPGPIFYIQKRYGKNKRLFWIYKFRTMKVDAENGRPIWGKEADPRSSKIGRFLRVSHIDELPQLFNVLNGEMSLVGPRPERPYFSERFKMSIFDYEKRYEVKPGITGWSQINGLRGESPVEDRTSYDIFYIENRSLSFYLKVLLLTPFAKPIRRHQKPSAAVEYYYDLTLSQTGEVLPENIPLMVPIRNA